MGQKNGENERQEGNERVREKTDLFIIHSIFHIKNHSTEMCIKLS